MHASSDHADLAGGGAQIGLKLMRKGLNVVVQHRLHSQVLLGVQLLHVIFGALELDDSVIRGAALQDPNADSLLAPQLQHQTMGAATSEGL